MSFWILCNFLQSQAQQNEEVQRAMEQLSIEIKRNQTLQQEQLATLETKMQLQMELQTLSSVAEQLEEERQQHDSMAKALSAAHQSSMELCEQLKRIDLQKLAGYEIFVNDMQRQQEQKEMEEMFRQRQDMCRKMENRHIVQKLRSKQAELTAVKKELQEADNYNQSIQTKALKKLEAAQKQHIDMVLSLVIGAKQLENLREEIKSVSNQQQEYQQLCMKKIELMEQLQKLQELPDSKLPNSDSITTPIEKKPISEGTQSIATKANVNTTDFYTSPTFDPYNPMDFIKSLDIKFDIGKAMQEFYLDLEAEKQKPETFSSEPTQNLRPILRPSNQNNESSQLATTTMTDSETRHVRFVEPNTSSSSSLSSPTPSSIVDDNMSSDENKMPLNANDNNDKNDEQREQNVSAAEIEAESLECLTLSSEISPAQSAKTVLLAKGAEIKSEPVVEILECRIVKPAGTAIPKTLPVSITPSPTKADEFGGTQTMEPIIAASPVEPKDTPKIFKSPINVLDNTIDTETSIKNVLQAFLKQPKQPIPTSKSEQPIKSNIRSKQSQSMDFDSYFLSNVSQESEEEDSCLQQETATDNGGTMFLDFGGSTEQLESDEALNFSDNDFQSHNRAVQDFF